MALFKTKSINQDKNLKPAETKRPAISDTASFTISKEPTDIILNPRVTEKATDKQQENVYVFEINPNSGKKMISRAFYQIYKVKPLKINIAKNPSKNVFVRSKKGVKKGVKKAYIYLKEGDKIDIL